MVDNKVIINQELEFENVMFYGEVIRKSVMRNCT